MFFYPMPFRSTDGLTCSSVCFDLFVSRAVAVVCILAVYITLHHLVPFPLSSTVHVHSYIFFFGVWCLVSLSFAISFLLHYRVSSVQLAIVLSSFLFPNVPRSALWVLCVGVAYQVGGRFVNR